MHLAQSGARVAETYYHHRQSTLTFLVLTKQFYLTEDIDAYMEQNCCFTRHCIWNSPISPTLEKLTGSFQLLSHTVNGPLEKKKKLLHL